MPTIRIMTWNVQGGSDPDLDLLHTVLREHDPQVVLLQEVERRQAERLAAMGGWASTWRFKHWPVIRPAQGQAVITSGSLRDDGVVVLAHRWAWCWWRRRIATVATVTVGASSFRVLNLHLAAGTAERRRTAEVRRLLASRAVTASAVLAGDLNTGPGAPTLAVLRDAGLTDRVRDGDPEADRRGATNWLPGPRTGPPSQWLDHVFVGAELEMVSTMVPRPDSPGFDRYPVLSDHLPVVADVILRPTR